MAGLQVGEGRMMIDSVVWAQYINVTHSHVAMTWQTHCHVAVANAAPTHCVGRQKWIFVKRLYGTICHFICEILDYYHFSSFGG